VASGRDGCAARAVEFEPAREVFESHLAIAVADRLKNAMHKCSNFRIWCLGSAAQCEGEHGQEKSHLSSILRTAHAETFLSSLRRCILPIILIALASSVLLLSDMNQRVRAHGEKWN